MNYSAKNSSSCIKACLVIFLRKPVGGLEILPNADKVTNHP